MSHPIRIKIEYITDQRYRAVAVGWRDWAVMDTQEVRVVCTCPKRTDANDIADRLNREPQNTPIIIGGDRLPTRLN